MVVNTPEEQVRQSLIQKMTGELGFPKGLISIERGIGPRRYDLLCYTQEMKPLLLVECKAHKLDDAVTQQALGYNREIKAPFLCLCGPNELKTFWHEQGKIGSVPFLPLFKDLYEMSKRL